MQKYTTEFAILGGGIAGLSAAIALQQIGINALVFEAAAEFKPVGAGLTLAPNAIQALEQLQLAAAVRANGSAINSFRICNEDGAILNAVNMRPEKGDASLDTIAIHRAALHRVLLSKVPDGKAITGKRSVSCTQSANGYTIVFEDGSTCLAKMVIVAEGIHSPVRKQLLPDAATRYSGYTCWRGIAGNSGIVLDAATESWGLAGRFGMVPVSSSEIYWYACINTTPGNTGFQQYTIKDIGAHFGHFHHPVPQVINATPQDQLVWGDICDLAPINRFAFDHLVLIGDAAHATTPNLGQGACMAIEDAVVLADELKRNSSVAHAFRSYEQRRLRRTTHIVQESWRMGRIAQLDQQLPVFLRNMVLSIVPGSVSLRRMKKIYALDHWYK